MKLFNVCANKLSLFLSLLILETQLVVLQYFPASLKILE